jgi:glycerol-3-phosphate O-acyltransferase/dihydroxyacetone phosphate acyltransferase
VTEPAHRAGRAITSAIVYTMYRSVEVSRHDTDLSERPVILVANHSAGFPDPVLLMYGMDRRPRFLAKATLWSNAAVAKVFDFAGVIPISRAEDGNTDGNLDAFAACHQALRDREVVAIFPEGKIHRESRIGDLHTGTARIALGARASGAAGIAIVPVGLYYEETRGRRGRIYAKVGDPIDLDADIGSYVEPGEADDDSNHEAVRRLTDDVSARLQGVAPDYSSANEWRVLTAAAEVALRSHQYDPSVPVSFGDREELAREMQSASPEARVVVLDAASEYSAILSTQRIRDVNVASYARVGGALPDHTVRMSGEAIALAPTATVGLVANLVPMVAMRLLSNRLHTNQLLKSTIQTLASPVLYAGAWTAWGAVLRRRGVRFGGTTAWLSGVIGGWALVLAAERSDVARDGFGGWIRMGVQGPSAEVRAARQNLIDAVEATTSQPTTL